MWGKELYFDATKVEANASLDSMGTRLVVEERFEERLAGIFPEQDAHSEEGAKSAPEVVGVVGPAGRKREALAEANARRPRWIEEPDANSGRWFGGATGGSQVSE